MDQLFISSYVIYRSSHTISVEKSWFRSRPRVSESK